MYKRKKYAWVNDKSVSNCIQCSDLFGFLNRKHHCRHCGNIFCYNCSNYWIVIPEYIKCPRVETGIFNLTTYLDYFNINKSKERVCVNCYIEIYELVELYKSTKLFNLLPLSIKDYINISKVCSSWKRISNFFIKEYLEIQYYLPDHHFSGTEQHIILNNIQYYSGHSKWIIPSIISINWDILDNYTTNKYIKFFENSKHVTCSSLFCDNTCKSALNASESLICLSKIKSNLFIIKYLLKPLYHIDIEEFICYTTYIVENLRGFVNFEIIEEFIKLFIQKSKVSTKFYNILFWELTQQIKGNHRKNLYLNIRKKILHNLDKKICKLFLNGFDFTQNILKLTRNTENLKDKLVEHFKKNDYTSNNNGFYLPINIDHTIVGIDYNNIKVIESKTRPLIIPCKSFKNNTPNCLNIMLKNEDIRKENIVMNIIKLIDIYLKRDLDIDFNIVSYNILPISNEYGYIELVPKSHTLYGIKEEQKFSIQNFIMEKNPNITAKQLRNNITKSCAALCVITYLLGIGDRHLDNIMITEEAHIFNIDFGYILGKDPKMLSPQFRLTEEMIDAMGGSHSLYFEEFKKYCKIIFNSLRNHMSIIYLLLLQLSDSTPPLNDTILTRDYIQNQIVKRFIPGQSYKEASVEFEYRIRSNSNTYSGSVIDFFHKKYKQKASLSDSSDESLYMSVILATKKISKLLNPI